MPIIQLYRQDEEYLSSDEAIRRIAPAFRHVVLDRARGEAEYRKEWDKVKSLNAPEVILQTYSLANCRTVWVELSNDERAALSRHCLAAASSVRMNQSRRSAAPWRCRQSCATFKSPIAVIPSASKRGSRSIPGR